MATNPKYPVQPAAPQPVNLGTPRQQRSLKLFVIGAVILLALVIVFLVAWLMQFGGGRPEEHPTPHQTPAPSAFYAPAVR